MTTASRNRVRPLSAPALGRHALPAVLTATLIALAASFGMSAHAESPSSGATAPRGSATPSRSGAAPASQSEGGGSMRSGSGDSLDDPGRQGSNAHRTGRDDSPQQTQHHNRARSENSPIHNEGGVPRNDQGKPIDPMTNPSSQ